MVSNLLIGGGALILNDKEQVLLAKRKNTKTFDGQWSRPGGTVELGERIEDTIVREVKEEVGIDIEIIRLLNITQDIRPEENIHGIYFGYLAKITSGEPRNMEPDKCSAIGWFPIRNNLPENLASYTKRSIDAYLTNEILID
ncbi:NUDIX domain-containing protein [Candidatus Woesearchaeota archaeon]|nr:NUDIX domain-containing protein [Candidatus Woesearchaeota archaeon]